MTFEEWWKKHEHVKRVHSFDEKQFNLIKKMCESAWTGGLIKGIYITENEFEQTRRRAVK